MESQLEMDKQVIQSDLDNNFNDDEINYYALFEDVSTGSDIAQIYQIVRQKGPVTVNKGLKEILRELSIAYAVDLDQARAYFTRKRNQDEFEDQIDLEQLINRDMTLDQVRHRLGNFFLRKVYEERGFEGGLKAYIQHIRYKPETPLPEEESQQEEEPPSAEQSTELQNEQLPVSEEIEDPQDDISLHESSPSRSIIHSPIRSIQRKDVWISLLIEISSDALIDLFNTHIEQALTPPDSLKEALDVILGSYKIQINPQAQSAFNKLTKVKTSQLSPASPEIMLSNFIKVAEEWAASNGPLLDDFSRQTYKTIRDYQQIRDVMIQKQQNASQVEELLQKVQKELIVYLQKKSKEVSVTKREKQMKTLNMLFQFYAKQRNVGGIATFEDINKTTTILSIGQFLKFLTDFGVMGRAQRERRLTREELIAIYKKHAENTRNMSFENLLSALEKIADVFYNDTYDRLNPFAPNTAGFPIEDKRNLLYDYFELDGDALNKAQGFGKAFSNEKAGYRLPEDDLSKKYKYKPRPTRPPLFKSRHNDIDSSKRKPLYYIPDRMQVELQKQQSSPIRKLPKSEKSAPTSNKSPDISVNYSKRYAPRAKSKETITWQHLRTLEYSDLAEPDELKDLLMSDEEQETRRSSNSLARYEKQQEQRYQNILRKHDQKISRGMYAANRYQCQFFVIKCRQLYSLRMEGLIWSCFEIGLRLLVRIFQRWLLVGIMIIHVSTEMSPGSLSKAEIPPILEMVANQFTAGPSQMKQQKNQNFQTEVWQPVQIQGQTPINLNFSSHTKKVPIQTENTHSSVKLQTAGKLQT